MASHLNIYTAQLNTHVGNLIANKNAIVKAYREGCTQGADLVITPEMSLTGYPLDDFAQRPAFLQAVKKIVDELCTIVSAGMPPLLVGAPWLDDGKLYNTALLIQDGHVGHAIRKHDLPNYGPFEEKRVYTSAPFAEPIEIKGHKIGILICEDLWTPPYSYHLASRGAKILVSVNASPYEEGKEEQRLAIARARCAETGLPLIYANIVGGADSLIFDGSSFCMDAYGFATSRLPEWQESGGMFRFNKDSAGFIRPIVGDINLQLPVVESLYSAVVLATRDYTLKNGFNKNVLGLSSGMDSTLCTTIAVDALGADNVLALMLGSTVTSGRSYNDALQTARNLGCHFSDQITIKEPFNASMAALHPFMGAPKKELTAQNFQARLRSLFLYGVSNDQGHLVLNTSNKSEAAMGHSTLYGDTGGGFSPLIDLFKAKNLQRSVYSLAEWRNNHISAICKGPAGAVIPRSVLEKIPSPELSEGETDLDLLPPYEILDPILIELMEKDRSIEETVAKGFDLQTVRLVAEKLQKNEFKRRLMSPGPKLSEKSFTVRDRRYPVTNGFQEWKYTL